LLFLSTLARLLFPAWGFFDVATSAPRLEVRARRAGETPGPWQPAVVAAPRRFRHLLFNPDGTRVLAEQTLVDRWVSECMNAAVHEQHVAADSASANSVSAHSVTALLTRQLAQSNVPLAWRTGIGAGWEYRVCVDADHDGTILGPFPGPC
jgi:hypothetical protein